MAYKHCFIYENGNYHEVPYVELFIENKRTPKYKGRYFLVINNSLLEVPFKDYQREHQKRRRQKYIKEEAKRNGQVSYNNLDTNDMNGEEIIRDLNTDVETEAIHSVMISSALQKLDEEERRLIVLLYFEGKTERECAQIFNLSQMGINKRKHRILDKLKIFIES